jgi:acetylornithine deacetylase
MKLTWYLVAAAAVAVTASPHPAYGQQQPLGSLLPASQGSIEEFENARVDNLIRLDPLLSLHRQLVEIESISTS